MSLTKQLRVKPIWSVCFSKRLAVFNRNSSNGWWYSPFFYALVSSPININQQDNRTLEHCSYDSKNQLAILLRFRKNSTEDHDRQWIYLLFVVSLPVPMDPGVLILSQTILSRSQFFPFFASFLQQRLWLVQFMSEKAWNFRLLSPVDPICGDYNRDFCGDNLQSNYVMYSIEV
jgi:hypothetical protein